MEKNWYVIYTTPRSEKMISRLFDRDGIEHYLPLIRRVRIWSDRKKKVDEPLFTSYIFVHITEKEHLKVLQTTGVVRFVTFEGKKIPVRNSEIEAIRRYLATGEEELENEQAFQTGKRVRVIRGSMKGLEGHLIEILNRQRVKVEIEAISQSLVLRIPKGSLEVL